MEINRKILRKRRKEKRTHVLLFDIFHSNQIYNQSYVFEWKIQISWRNCIAFFDSFISDCYHLLVTCYISKQKCKSLIRNLVQWFLPNYRSISEIITRLSILLDIVQMYIIDILHSSCYSSFHNHKLLQHILLFSDIRNTTKFLGNLIQPFRSAFLQNIHLENIRNIFQCQSFLMQENCNL